MRFPGSLLCVCLLLLPFTAIFAQKVTSGVITYEQITDYQLEDAIDHPLWADYIEGLPKRGKSVHQLIFTDQESFYAEDLNRKEVISDQLKQALMKANYDKTPQPEPRQFYYNFAERQKVEQVEFMTRSFRVRSDLVDLPWKLNGKQKKVLDYICMGADLQMGQEQITAWFTPQIPASIGPGLYFGLPGAILGLEKNGAVFLLATAIELKPPEQELSAMLDKGQKVSKAEFDTLVKEKTAQYKKDQAARKNALKKGSYQKN